MSQPTQPQQTFVAQQQQTPNNVVYQTAQSAPQVCRCLNKSHIDDPFSKLHVAWLLFLMELSLM
jgi:hypothetical protein